MTPLRLAVVGLKCYDLLAEAPRPRYVGGAERQLVLLARGLAARGHHVSMVTLDEGQPEAAVHHGVRVFPAYASAAGRRGVRFVHPRWSGLTAALRRADADVIYQMGGDSETGQVAAWCLWRSRRFVFSVASDADIDPVLPLLRTARQRLLYRFGLKRASAVVAQTTHQRDRLHGAFGVDARVIRNCAPDPGFDARHAALRAANPRPRLLWVGRFVAVKRPELFLEVAAARPGWDFHLVGSGDPADDRVRALVARAGALPNVTLHLGLGDDALDEQYRRANALLCTSSLEGVPTTFLEAWARGLPVVSTIDPDGVIRREQLGAIAAPPDLASAVDAVLGGDPRGLAGRLRAHFLATHTIDAFVRSHEEVLAGPPRRPAAAAAPHTLQAR